LIQLLLGSIDIPKFVMHKSLKVLSAGFTAVMLLSPACDSAKAATHVSDLDFENPTYLYGNEIYFDVYRNGTKTGYHRVSFENSDSHLSVNVTFILKIDVLFLTVYRYHYESKSIWQNGRLLQLHASVDDNGTLSLMDATRTGDIISVSNGFEVFKTPAPIQPTDHWNPTVLGQSRVLNTITGAVNEVHITNQGRTEVQTEAGPVAATHYVYTGDLQTEVWYDDAGRWVKMRFKGKDGSDIEYHCRRCQGKGTGSQKVKS